MAPKFLLFIGRNSDISLIFLQSLIKLSKVLSWITHILINNPGVGKPLKYELAGLMSIRVTKSRLIFEIRGDTIVLHKFEHRKSVYK